MLERKKMHKGRSKVQKEKKKQKERKDTPVLFLILYKQDHSKIGVGNG